MRCWLFWILWGWAATCPADAQPLKVGVNDGNGEPYAFLENGQVLRGIVKDISDAVGEALGRPVEYEVLPRKRLEAALLTGDIDFIPIYNPGWTEDPNRFQWSPPLFDERNRIVVRSTWQHPVEGPRDLDGLTLGTIRGYWYPTLEEAFRRPGGPQREDAVNLIQNLQKLTSGRIDAVVDSEVLLDWHLRDEAKAFHGWTLAPWVVSSQKISWAFLPRPGMPTTAVNRAFQQLKDNGTIERILRAYR